jgi:preprotein translocase subunit YajC
MGQLVVILPMFAVMYFLLIRPQQKKLKQQRDMQSAVAVGDEVVTSGGMYGIVTAMDDVDIWVEVADGVDIRFARGAILRVSRRAADEVDGDDAGDAIATGGAAGELPAAAAERPHSVETAIDEALESDK